MSHPNPSHDRSNEYPDDHYKPVAKHSFGKGKVLFKSKGFDAAEAKHKALKKKTEYYKDFSGKRRPMTSALKKAIGSINHKHALRVKRREDR